MTTLPNTNQTAQADTHKVGYTHTQAVAPKALDDKPMNGLTINMTVHQSFHADVLGFVVTTEIAYHDICYIVENLSETALVERLACPVSDVATLSTHQEQLKALVHAVCRLVMAYHNSSTLVEYADMVNSLCHALNMLKTLKTPCEPLPLLVCCYDIVNELNGIDDINFDGGDISQIIDEFKQQLNELDKYSCVSDVIRAIAKIGGVDLS